MYEFVSFCDKVNANMQYTANYPVVFSAWSGNFTWLIVTLSVLGKMGFTSSFGGVYAQTPELYPTNMRNVGLGASSMFARIANFTAPLFRILVGNSPVTLSL